MRFRTLDASDLRNLLIIKFILYLPLQILIFRSFRPPILYHNTHTIATKNLRCFHIGGLLSRCDKIDDISILYAFFSLFSIFSISREISPNASLLSEYGGNFISSYEKQVEGEYYEKQKRI